MRFELYNPKGKLFTPGRSYFLLSYKPLPPNSDVWGKRTFGFRVIPDKPLDEDNLGYIYAAPRQIITNLFTAEYATDPEWEIRTLYKEK
jgi:hypothetical protein